MLIFATVHTALLHPLFAAKQLAVADHVGHGRLGLNIVCGWNKNNDDHGMFGLPRLGHDTRYEPSEERWDIV